MYYANTEHNIKEAKSKIEILQKRDFNEVTKQDWEEYKVYVTDFTSNCSDYIEHLIDLIGESDEKRYKNKNVIDALEKQLQEQKSLIEDLEKQNDLLLERIHRLGE